MGATTRARADDRPGFRPEVDAPTPTDDDLLDRVRERARDLQAAAEVGRYQGAQTAEAVVEPKAEALRGEDPGVVRNAIADGFQALAVAAVTLAVTLFVTGMVFDTMPSNGAFSNESTEVENMTGDAFVLGGVALIIMVAGIILWLVGGFGQRGGGRI